MTRNWFEKSRNAWEELGVSQSNTMFDKKTVRGKLQAEELQWVISHISTGAQKILDAGCGPGRYTKIFAEEGKMVVSYDFSRSILKLLQKNLGGIRSILIQGNIQTLPFKDNQFDVVLILDVLHHLETKEMRMNAIKEGFRVSKQYVFLDVKNKYNPYLWYRYKKIKDPFLRVGYTYYEILNAVQESGGRVIESKGLGFPLIFVAPYILIKAVTTCSYETNCRHRASCACPFIQKCYLGVGKKRA